MNEERGRMSSHTLFLLQLLSSSSLLYFCICSVYASWTLSSLSKKWRWRWSSYPCAYISFSCFCQLLIQEPTFLFPKLTWLRSERKRSASDAEQTKTSENRESLLWEDVFSFWSKKRTRWVYFLICLSLSLHLHRRSSHQRREMKKKVQDKRKVSSGRQGKKQTTETTQQEGWDLILRSRTNTHPFTLLSSLPSHLSLSLLSPSLSLSSFSLSCLVSL